ncbi:hypothetical protein DAPPUDRAFT_234625 [Daphnia pulex]|uniref:Uncharacterized protein n=1 Tax=Daphnia pulex TaxID=6669 RepID=E9FX21_DAPPU|nr:hypothetical protein DAPPUDRAFT_234625 [Daphnia pulex]|eukprot:EFX87995.1 hypothetical protein DAPPUDRAFT_234625 [Daphnia pulex]
MSVAQVERLTQVVYAALNSQECIQRLLCEIGSLSRSFSDATRTVTKAVEEYVPEKLKDSFNIFAKAEKCEHDPFKIQEVQRISVTGKEITFDILNQTKHGEQSNGIPLHQLIFSCKDINFFSNTNSIMASMAMAPMPYSPPMAYSPPMPYAAPAPPSYAPPSYAPPAYAPPSYDAPYNNYESAPIELAPLVEDLSAGGAGGGGGGLMTKFLALPPPLILLPILIPIIVIVIVLGGGGGGGAGGKKPFFPFGVATTTQAYNDTAYYDESGYGNEYQDDNNNYNNNNDDNNYNNSNSNRPHQGYNNRYRRQAQKNKNIPATSSALPSMSVAQVERLTQVVYAAMNSQECIQRLLCEIGSLSRSFSDATRTVTKAVEEYVPEKLKDSFNIFAKAEKCEQFRCGSLKT